MPASEIDRSPQPNADQIRRRDFATVRRGYDPGQVRGYLDSVAQRMESLEQELRAAKYAADTAAKRASSAVPAPPQTDPYDAFAKKFAGLIGTADKEANRLLEDARGESHRIMEEARADSERIRVDAQARSEEARAEAERVLEQARQQADRALSTMAERRRQLADRLQAMQVHLTSAAQDLDVPAHQVTGVPAAKEGASADVAARTRSEPSNDEGSPGGPSPRVPEPGEQDRDVQEPGQMANADTLFGAGESESRPDAEAEAPPYEDLWVTPEDAVDIPDLASIELDFDDDRPAGDR